MSTTEREDDRVQRWTRLDGTYEDAFGHGTNDEPGRERDREREPVRHTVLDDDQRDVRREHRHRPLGVVDDARRAPDHHQSERDGRVDHAVDDPVDGVDGEEVHQNPR